MLLACPDGGISGNGSTVVRKLALGWQIVDQVKFRYSTNETFRAPAMILVNEGFLGRSTATNDALLQYASGVDQDNYSMQRITEGNKRTSTQQFQIQSGRRPSVRIGVTC